MVALAKLSRYFSELLEACKTTNDDDVKRSTIVNPQLS
jgi:hypothetical protein